PGGELEAELRIMAENTLETLPKLVREFKLHAALEEVLQLVRRANKYMEQTEPWKLAKSDLASAGTALWHVLEIFRLAATLLSPVIPGKIDNLLHQLGLDQGHLQLAWGVLPAGIQTRTAEVLFPRQEYIQEISQETEQSMDKPSEQITTAPAIDSPAQASDPTQPNNPAPEPIPGVLQIGIDDFAKVQLRVAEVVEAERVPKTDKLLRLVVDLGDERRQIVAGVASWYEPEQLLGKQIVIVANLKPVKLRGVESHGMLLAAKSEGKLSVLTPMGEVATGASIS
ncbi:MAG: methionine--tRNA ligase subunit beta, partial [Candidatus Melainabacteria bacterium HGW-Melainabacteria-1]